MTCQMVHGQLCFLSVKFQEAMSQLNSILAVFQLKWLTMTVTKMCIGCRMVWECKFFESVLPFLIRPYFDEVVELYESWIFFSAVTTFSIIPQTPLSVMEGDILPNSVKILKSNNTIITYTVTLMTQGLTSSSGYWWNTLHPRLVTLNLPSDLADLIVTETYYTFHPSISARNIHLEATDNLKFSEGRKEFLISIASIEAVNATGALTAIEGAPLTVIVYNNDCKSINDIFHCWNSPQLLSFPCVVIVGFTENQITVRENTTSTACVKLFGTEDDIIGPTQSIELELSLVPDTSSSGNTVD